MRRHLPLLIHLPLCAAGCGDQAPADPGRTFRWSHQAEALHQARELLRYEDQQQHLRLAQLRALGVDPPGPSAAAQPPPAHGNEH